VTVTRARRAKSRKVAARSSGAFTPLRSAPIAEVRIGPLMPIPSLLREMRRDPEQIFATVGLDLALFDNPDRRIPFATAGALLEQCVAATGVPHFGLLVGARFELPMLGILEHLMRNCESLRVALLNLVRHLHLQDNGAVPFLIDLGHERTALGYVLYRHDIPGIAHIYDIAIAVGSGILRSLCGTSWRPERVTLAHTAPRDSSPYRRFFNAPVHFDAAHSEIIFLTRWLDSPIAGADLSRHVAAQRLALTIERGSDGRLIERVQRAVQGLVMAGDATAERVSALLGIHERVLRRRLHGEGTSIQQIIGNARFQVAQQLLKETQLPLAEIAASLQYSDATAFSRAFRAWSNMTPSAWRSAVASSRKADTAGTRTRGARSRAGSRQRVRASR